MEFKFFDSNQVKIFPNSRRGLGTVDNKVQVYDPESRLTTEHTLTHLYGLAFGRDSYIISKPAGTDNHWKMVIHGYYFEVTTNDSDIDYFIIGIEDTSSIPSTRLASLTQSNGTPTIDKYATKLDTDINGISKCMALCAVSAGGEKLSLGSQNLYYVDTEDTLEKLRSDFASATDVADLKTRMGTAEGDITTLDTDKLDKSVYDAYIADKAMSDADLKKYAEDEADNAVTEANAYTDDEVAKLEDADLAITKRLDVIEGADTVDGSIAKALNEAKAYADQAELDAVATANIYADSLASNYDAAGSAATAEQNAKDYVDGAVDTLSEEDLRLADLISGNKTAIDNEVIAREDAVRAINTKIGAVTDSNDVVTMISDAQAAAITSANGYTDAKLSDLENGQVKTNKEAIASLQTADTRIEGLISDRKAVDEALDARLGKVEAFFEGAYTEDGQPVKEALDTLVEIQNYLNGEGSGADGLVGQVTANTEAISGLKDRVATAENDITNLLAADNTLKNSIEKEQTRAQGVESGFDGRIQDMEAFFEGAAKGEGENFDTLKEIQVELNTILDALRSGVYVVTFDANGGNGEIAPQYIILNKDKYILPPANEFSRSGFTFAGWYHNRVLDGTDTPEQPETEVNLVNFGSHSTFYAIWSCDHDWADATCTAPKTCAACGATDGEALGHDYSPNWTVDIHPTCTEAGSQSHHCTRCDAKTDITEIAALGHTLTQVDAKAPTCTETGYDAYEYCSVCDYTTYEEIKATGHNYVDGKCTDCDVLETETEIEPESELSTEA